MALFTGLYVIIIFAFQIICASAIAASASPAHSNISRSNNQIVPGTYRFENVADGLHLTIQGVNSSFATVVGDTWHNFREQRWAIKKMPFTTGFHFQPETYMSNNILSFHKDPLKKYAQPELWMFKEVKTTGRTYFNLVNERTTYCLSSAGRRRQVTELKCDKYQRNQQWNPILL